MKKKKEFVKQMEREMNGSISVVFTEKGCFLDVNDVEELIYQYNSVPQHVIEAISTVVAVSDDSFKQKIINNFKKNFINKKSEGRIFKI